MTSESRPSLPICDTGARTPNPRIPRDLFRPILECLDRHRPTLCTVALCSRLLREEAERELYSHFDEAISSDTSRHIAFLSTLMQHPHLASIVKVYHSADVVHYYSNAPLWSLVNEALTCMNGLKVLHLESLPGTTYPSTCCPSLKKLSGNRATLEALLPGRRIEDVTWIPDFPLGANFESADEPQMKTELGHLKTFSFGGLVPRPHFELIVGHLNRLEKLELVGLFPQEVELLQHLQFLRELSFSFTWGSLCLPIPRESNYLRDQRLVGDLFSSCANLVRVDIAYDWATITEVRYQRWTRETMQGSIVLIPMVVNRNGRIERSVEW